jgi:hypothetical protein
MGDDAGKRIETKVGHRGRRDRRSRLLRRHQLAHAGPSAALGRQARHHHAGRTGFADTLEADAAKAADVSIQYDLQSLAGDLRREATDVTADNRPAVSTDDAQYSADQQKLFDDCRGP